AGLEVQAEVGVRLDGRADDAMPEGDRLRGHTAAMDARYNVHTRAVPSHLQRLLGGALKLDAGEELVEVPAVDLVGAVARPQRHTRNGALALAGGRVACVGGEVERLARHGLGLGRLLRGPGLLLGRRLGHLGACVLAELVLLTLLLEHQVRLEVGAGDDLLFLFLVALLAAAPWARLLGGGLGSLFGLWSLFGLRSLFGLWSLLGLGILL